MNKIRSFNHIGEFISSYHKGQPILIHCQYDVIRVFSFDTLQEISKVTFKNPIANIHIPNFEPSNSLRFVMISENKSAYIVYLDGNEFKMGGNVDIEENIMENHCLLSDNNGACYILFESGSVYRIPKKTVDKFSIKWDEKRGSIRRLLSTSKYNNQDEIIPNSDAFLAIHRTNNGCHIYSYIINFDNKRIFDGPYHIEISLDSQYISSNYFIQNNYLYSIFPFKKLMEIDDIICNSNVDHENSMVFVTNDGIVYKATPTNVTEITRLHNNPCHIEALKNDFIYVYSDGTINSYKSKASIKVSVPFSMTEYRNILIRCGGNSIIPFPISAIAEPKITSSQIKKTSILSSNGAEWNSKNEIISTSSYSAGDDEYIIAATVASIHIIRFSLVQNNFEVVLEKEWNSAIICVAIYAEYYAVSSLDIGIQVSSYQRQDYSFTFHQGICLALSLSDTTLAAGFEDGNFILASLHDKGPILTERPFAVPIKSLQHVDDTSVIVEWGEVTGLVTKDYIKWIKLPEFPGAQISAFAGDLIALGATNGLSIYNFPTKNLVAVVPKRIISVCSSSVCFDAIGSVGVRFFVLTYKNELGVLYFHKDVDIDQKSVIDAEDPLIIATVDESAYVICSRYLYIYDMRGNRIDTIEFSCQPRFCESTSRGVYVAFSRSIWYISRDHATKKIPHVKSNITNFTAIDDQRFIVSTSTKITYAYPKGGNISLVTIVKITKKVLSMKCISSKLSSEVDTLAVIYEDDSLEMYPLPNINE